jgi:hypothetical protein
MKRSERCWIRTDLLPALKGEAFRPLNPHFGKNVGLNIASSFNNPYSYICMMQPQVSAKLALLLIKEASSRETPVKLRYCKVYRTIKHWLGKEYADYILDRLKSGGIIKIEGERIEVLKPVQSTESIDSLARSARSIIFNMPASLPPQT